MPERITRCKTIFKDLGFLDYHCALDIQLSMVSSKIENSDIADCIFFVEHPPVFTLGKNGGQENLSVSQSYLESKKIQVIQTGRGGNITYHCPGQIVVYPVINLEKRKIGVKDFVYNLENIMIRTAEDFGVHAERNPLNHGIWVQNSKLGSIGLGIKKSISFHGLALNVCPDLTPFSWINPCGLEGVSMTSLENELKKSPFPGINLSMPRIKEKFKHHFINFLNT